MKSSKNKTLQKQFKKLAFVTWILIKLNVLGGKIKLKSTLDPKRVFKLKVKEAEPDKKLVWGDGQGNRVYTITKNRENAHIFSMTEKIGSPLFPLYAKYIPSFDSSFQQFALDLKKEAETIQNSKNWKHGKWNKRKPLEVENSPVDFRVWNV